MIFSMEDGGLCTFPPNVAHQLTPQYWCFSNAEPKEMDVDVYALYVFTIVRADDGTNIRRMRLETAESWDTIIQLPSSDVRGLAVDWVASNLYITDAERREIVISSLDGSYVTTLVDSDISRPTALVVHAPKQYLFWSDTGANPRIERTDLSGRRDRRVLVNTDIESPTHLVIDMRNDRIYWADGETLFIESIDLDGQGREVFYNYSGLVDDPFFHFTGLAIFQDLLYATEVGNALRVFEIPNKSLIKSIGFPGEMKTMKFFHESLQPISQGPCDVSNGGCDEICINTKYGAECVCSQPSCTPGMNTIIAIIPIHNPITLANGKLVFQCDNINGRSSDFTCNSGYIRAIDNPVTIELHCVSEPCLNEGICTDIDGGFNCTCPSQWQGDVCDTYMPNKEPKNGGFSTGAVIGVSFVVVVLVIVAVVLLVLFRGKILRKSGYSETPFDDIFLRNKSSNAYSGAPIAPPTSAPAAPRASPASASAAHMQSGRQMNLELKIRSIERPQQLNLVAYDPMSRMYSQLTTTIPTWQLQLTVKPMTFCQIRLT
ncbi:pro-epidermal growth factor-like [Ptychodera flava]|uniref:pro-epidermal growth factor-like n=1 Tax=Ptychodera flava TaxID=63121 RepID=UPI00396AABC8